MTKRIFIFLDSCFRRNDKVGQECLSFKWNAFCRHIESQDVLYGYVWLYCVRRGKNKTSVLPTAEYPLAYLICDIIRRPEREGSLTGDSSV